eukprot:8133511-Prorocentrum_lima.AAC.1
MRLINLFSPPTPSPISQMLNFCHQSPTKDVVVSATAVDWPSATFMADLVVSEDIEHCKCSSLAFSTHN